MTYVALSLGSNLGDRARNIGTMECLLKKVILEPVKRSSLMETEPLGVAEKQPWYYNRIITGYYEGSALTLLENLEGLERVLGREHKGLLRPRTADLDLLLFGDAEVKTERLTIPHRGILQRRFVLEGLNQIDPDRVLPLTGKTVKWFFEHMDEEVKTQRINFIQN